MNKKSSSLKAGIHYLKNWSQFVDWFHDEQACRDYLYTLRWPNGFICPNCLAHKAPYSLAKNKLKCTQCRKQTSVTAGTIFDKTRTPLKDWFAAIWYLTNQKNGVSALGIQRLLGLGSYQTAWSILHRLRYAMINPERDKLSGIIEVDETFVGVLVNINQQDKKKFVVLIAIELIEPKGFGRIRLRQVDRATKSNIEQFIVDVIEPDSQIGSNIPAHETMPGVHRVASLLKRWLLGTYQGAVQSKHLDYYLDEYTFRFNRRKSRSRGLLFYRLLEQSVTTKPLTYKGIRAR
ncbi:IS1595 family transposase [Marinomonas algarum]|uniref:IS1595 family transposase n=1 Tax=Marinomonas algarum TaxID=2883105 RepID=A0A9X1IP67_9GAMM|nr:IS1595 family transposase [Marinomonas algarum]MCB5162602.1 IS1595 family transposase [Marinomonas algarum]